MKYMSVPLAFHFDSLDFSGRLPVAVNQQVALYAFGLMQELKSTLEPGSFSYTELR